MVKTVDVSSTTLVGVAQQSILPQDGVSRYGQLRPFIALSREKWRQLVRDGKAPTPIRMGVRCTVWRNADIHAWLADPLNYSAEAAE
ncbi:helix-turn-helix transcriptional regulator [Cupriavidus basilensis]|uniref:helix-turn-helix transcriptional regulator n=1 Tax=Cupriavidus basilensis TaxID=68895 RepID=UPI00157A328F|nr:AlpA family phage regulatory protein [Cupriavidus basilensis]NUA26131.1 AlpA family phage regulatory protein [Cupriavidus basilensis]